MIIVLHRLLGVNFVFPLLIFFFDWMTHWIWRRATSKLKLASKCLWNYTLKANWKVLNPHLMFSLYIIFVNDVELKPYKWNKNSSMKFYGSLRWNEVYPKKSSILLFYVSEVSFTHIFVFCIKIHPNFMDEKSMRYHY
jgi:hypothetical protein